MLESERGEILEYIHLIEIKLNFGKEKIKKSLSKSTKTIPIIEKHYSLLDRIEEVEIEVSSVKKSILDGEMYYGYMFTFEDKLFALIEPLRTKIPHFRDKFSWVTMLRKEKIRNILDDDNIQITKANAFA